jgi:hypothetical protein
MAQAMK